MLQRFHGQGSLSNWQHQEFQDTLTRAREHPDYQQHCRLIEQAEAIFAREMPATPLLQMQDICIYSDYLCGIYPNAMGDVYFDRAWFDEERKAASEKTEREPLRMSPARRKDERC